MERTGTADQAIEPDLPRAPVEPEPPPTGRAWVPKLARSHTVPGLAAGLVVACLSFTPSLLSRAPYGTGPGGPSELRPSSWSR